MHRKSSLLRCWVPLPWSCSATPSSPASCSTDPRRRTAAGSSSPSAWALAVFAGVLIAGPFSGAHLNPAVTLGLALSGTIGWDLAVVYWAAEFLGAFIGAVLVYLHYCRTGPRPRTPISSSPSTAPGPRSATPPRNFVERVPRHVRAGVRDPRHRSDPRRPASRPSARCRSRSWSWSSACPSAAPPATRSTRPATSARASPHFLLPIPGKRDSDWAYAWIPVVGPMLGGARGVLRLQRVWSRTT